MANYVKQTWTDDVSALSAARMGVIENGIFDAHFQPAARVFHNAAQSIAYNALTVLAFNSERFDTDTIHDTVTNNSRLTCKTAGKYLIGGNIEWSNVVTTSIVQVFLNAATVIGDSFKVVDDRRSQVTSFYDLAVNDFVELRVLQTNGGATALNVNAAGNYSPEFWMVRLA